MTQFLTQDSLVPPYMAFPRFLLDKDGPLTSRYFNSRSNKMAYSCTL